MVASTAAIASWWPFWRDEAPTGLLNLLVAVTFAATAAVLSADREQRGTARAIALAATFYLTSWWWAWPAQWQAGPLPLVSFVTGYLWFAFGGLALIRYPEAQLARRYERWFFVILAGWICGVKLLLAVVSWPTWAGYADVAWWPTLLPQRVVFDTGTAVFNAGLVVLTLGLILLLLVKLRRVRGLELVDAAPAAFAAAAVAVCGVVYLTARIAALPTAVQDQLRIVTAVAALSTPLAFLVAVLRRQLVKNAAVTFVSRITRTSTTCDIEHELQRVLRDPTLRLWLWRPALHAYTDTAGAPSEPASTDDQVLVTISSTEDTPLAMFAMSQSVQRHHDLVESVTHAVGLELERQTKLEEVLASRTRINEAELAARRGIARDLHDGAQQVLLTARLRLAVARRRAADDADTRDAIDSVGTEVDSALAVIRDLAAGNNPSLLRQGLAEALPELVRDLGIPVELHVTRARFETSIERNIWFLVSEAITNMRKHAGAHALTITVAQHAEQVVVRVSDDGRGGAQAHHGTGLAGMADRVHTLGGRMHLDSPVGGGTRIEVVLPCA